MEQKQFSVSYEPSAYNEKVCVYAVNPNAKYASVEQIQIANSTTSGFDMDVFWVDYSDVTVSSTNYYGDGSIRQEYYDYGGSALNSIIQNALVPKGSSLAVLNSPLYLDPKDFIFLRPASSGSGTAFKPLVTVTEYFEDGTYMSTSVDLVTTNTNLIAQTY
tara:strand:- start:286 stop:768 length:483 start_codon:yes stop_codon:yes gene_type:complete